MAKIKSQNFTEGPILKMLASFALPVLFALFLQSLYGAVDLLVVGQFASPKDVSAVSTGSQILHTLTNLIASFSMGTTILLGQKIGEGNSREGGKIIGASIWLFTILGLLMTFLTVFGAPFFACIMNAPEEAFSATVHYIRICGAGLLVIIAYNLIGSIFRGLGDSTTPLYTVAIAAVINIFGDLFLVAVLHLGAEGAAIATVLAQMVSVLCSLLLIRKQKLPFTFDRKDIRLASLICRKIITLGLPLALSDFLVGLSFLIILSIVNSLGLLASAGVGVAEKVCAFIMLVAAAFSQSMAAFVAQNTGAGKPERSLKALRAGIAMSLAAGVFMGWLTFFHGDALAGFFSRDPEVVSTAWEYLKAYAIDCLLTSFLFCFIGFFNGVGQTRFVMLQGIIGAFGVRVPVSFLMSRMTPVSIFHIGLATPASSSIQIILCFAALHFYRKKQKSPLRITEEPAL